MGLEAQPVPASCAQSLARPKPSHILSDNTVLAGSHPWLAHLEVGMAGRRPGSALSRRHSASNKSQQHSADNTALGGVERGPKNLFSATLHTTGDAAPAILHSVPHWGIFSDAAERRDDSRTENTEG